MPRILPAVACNLDTNILTACLPLLEESRVEAIEWSFDALFKVKQVPDWFLELLTAFSKEGRLIGHGVFFSLFSGKWLPKQETWLQQLQQTTAAFRFDHVTEHFGFMTGRDFHHGAPLNIPYTQSTLAIGQDRLLRIQTACCCPVGLENLAFSYCLDEVKQHGEFLDALLEPVNGFIILDLHNLYCQLNNFDIAFDELIALYPLDKVREIHISGGSWEDSYIIPGRKVRRDTHDDSVPPEVFRLLEIVIGRCPNLKYVVMEQLGNGLATEDSRTSFYRDFLRLEAIVNESNTGRFSDPVDMSFLPPLSGMTHLPIEDETLYQQQLELSAILETAGSYGEAKQRLDQSTLAHSAWQIENWEPYMLETAINIARKWATVAR
ncbi:MAG TPA: DUF692 family protein [Puia sp.]|nr:DUF692 family protein [Puia sp.]